MALVVAGHVASGPTIDLIVSALMMPGFFLAALFGARGGPDGMPSMVYVLGFGWIFWSLAIDLVWTAWRWAAHPGEG